MRIDQRHQLIRLQLLNNGNFGMAGGRATLDRPTQLDIFLGLPFIPNSTLRGVWRNWVELQANGSNRADFVFGTRDDSQSTSRVVNSPGKLLIGNGDLLAFPVLAATGERCWIVSLHNLCKYIELEKLCGHTTAIQKLATAVCRTEGNVLGIPEVPLLDLPIKLKQVNVASLESEFQCVRKLLMRWFIQWLPDDEAIVIGDGASVKYLWRLAAEIRDLTALEHNKTARGQSLRRVETIPEGSLFLSLVTWLGSVPIDFGDTTIQIGSGEGVGSGFCRMAAVLQTISNPVDNATFGAVERWPRERDDESMSDIYSAISAMAEEEQSDFKMSVRSAIGNLGWRIKNEGWEPALAFALAKAKPSVASVDVSKEARAYRWLLQQLLKTDGSLLRRRDRSWFAEEMDVAEKSEVMQRWLWLRKFGEIKLANLSSEG